MLNQGPFLSAIWALASPEGRADGGQAFSAPQDDVLVSSCWFLP
jgi:hypothetical protein